MHNYIPEDYQFFNQELLYVGDKKAKCQHLDTREKVIYCFCHLDGLEGIETYLRKLVVDTAHRIYRKRVKPDKVRFGHNETIMIERLYWYLK